MIRWNAGCVNITQNDIEIYFSKKKNVQRKLKKEIEEEEMTGNKLYVTDQTSQICRRI